MNHVFGADPDPTRFGVDRISGSILPRRSALPEPCRDGKSGKCNHHERRAVESLVYMHIAVVLLLLSVPLAGQTLARRIDTILNSSPGTRQTFWGIHVVDAGTGATVYRRNENHFFIPASNTKLFSTALALMRLGPDHRFHTIVAADVKPGASGHVREIRLIGGGDPNLSGRLVPYQKGTETKANPFEVFDALADQVVRSGVKLVEGDIAGDDTAYFWEPFPDGWAADDAIWEYGAPVSALTLNDNAFTLFVDPDSPGGPGRLTLNPVFEHLTIHNRTQTGTSGKTKIAVARLPGSSELSVSGVVVPGTKRNENMLAIDDPALFAAHVFRAALLRRGVIVNGGARALHRRQTDPPAVASGFELARHSSGPLIEDLQIINKVSQNLHAEIVLREVARKQDGVGSRERGLEELTAFLTEIGVPAKQYNFEDGSGLSRLTLVTPATVTHLLRYMHGTSYRDAWINTLPIAGDDGTLRLRFDGIPRPGIRAKTGSISHVSSLAGYATRKSGRRYAFSIVANNYNAESLAIRKLIDRVALALIN
jgi:serine-type D-Ala-D-Ala carboxypeptidase/endopeptidase (penicillin-binding protein 4)